MKGCPVCLVIFIANTILNELRLVNNIHQINRLTLALSSKKIAEGKKWPTSVWGREEERSLAHAESMLLPKGEQKHTLEIILLAARKQSSSSSSRRQWLIAKLMLLLLPCRPFLLLPRLQLLLQRSLRCALHAKFMPKKSKGDVFTLLKEQHKVYFGEDEEDNAVTASEKMTKI